MTENNFAKRFTEIRKKKGITQEKLGEMLGVSNRAVSKWERGTALPSTENVYKLSKIFGVPVDTFFGARSPKKDDGCPSLKMKSIISLYRIGKGPSSSHTIGPERACRIIAESYGQADRFEAVLYGSLAKTREGHGTDRVIRETFAPVPCTVKNDLTNHKLRHPNTMDVLVYSRGELLAKCRVESVGGGKIVIDGKEYGEGEDVYDVTSFEKIADFCRANNVRLWQYVEHIEGPAVMEHLAKVWEQMKLSIERGLADDGILPGGLGVHKRAKQLIGKQHIDESAETRENRMVCAYAFAVSEQNASAKTVVTAPTCGAAGVLPAVLYYQQIKRGYSDTEIIRTLAAGGIIGNLVKTNASISGSECGCQAEIGTACAMAAAALAELFLLDLDKIEYAAEIAIEHHLGLTCDPICGLVQIPCIERNAVAAMRAINAVSLASFLADSRKISLDKVIKVMHKTGLDIKHQYKETAEGGLADLKF